MSRKAMQMALEALELLARYENPSTKIQVRKPKEDGSIVTMYPHKVATEAAALLRERLAQPEQEPVDSAEKAAAYLDARLWEFIDMAAAWPEAKPDPRIWGHVMVYAPKQPSKPWVGLTADEIWKCNKASGSSVEFHICYEHQNVLDFAEAIEAKLKEKNGG